MKRSNIIKQLMNEGFSEKTLVNFSDKQLKSLSERILSEEVKNIYTPEDLKKPDVIRNITALTQGDKKTDITVARKGTTIVTEKEIEECDGKLSGLKSKKTGEKLGHGTVKEEGPMPGLTIKGKSSSIKTSSKFKKENDEEEINEKKKTFNFDKKKKIEGGKEKTKKVDDASTGKNLKEKTIKKPIAEKDSQGFVLLKWKDNGKFEIVKHFKYNLGKNTDYKGATLLGMYETSKEANNDANKLEKDKKGEQKQVNEWVENVVKKHYHPFTSKSDIMEMISSKMKEMNEIDKDDKLPGFLKAKAIKSRGEVGTMTAPAQPKTKPGVKPDTRPGERPRKNPYQPPFPRKDPHPKAINPETVMPSEVAESKKIPAIKPGQKK